MGGCQAKIKNPAQKSDLEAGGIHQVVLLGDSTIDNLVWVKNYDQSISGQLNKLLQGWKIFNYAADGFTTSDLLNGAIPQISYRARKSTPDAFPLQQLSTFEPLNQLEKLPNSPHVLLSIGGNDIRIILGKIQMIKQVISEMVNNQNKILQRLLKKTPKVIVMLQYRPSAKEDGVYGVYKALQNIDPQTPPMAIMNNLMENIYKQVVFPTAIQHRLPIIDLPNSIDPYNGKLFECQIEPSYLGGQKIAQLVAHVLQNHNFDKDQAKIYSLKDDVVVADDMPTDWKIK